MRQYLTALSLLAFFCVPFLMAQEEEKNMAITLEDRDIDRFHDECARLEQGDVDLLFVGDSITHFWEWSGKEVWERYYGNRKAMNFGIGGDRTGHVLWRLENAPMEKISPKAVVLLIGSNNVGHESSTAPQTIQGIQLCVDKLKSLYPNAKIILLDLLVREPFSAHPLREAMYEINRGIEEIYGGGKVENVQTLDINSFLLNENGNLPVEVMNDFLHPTPFGYEVMAAALEPYIVEALGENPHEVNGYPKAFNNEWWNGRFSEGCLVIEQNPDTQLLMLGDSITDNWHLYPGIWTKYFGDKKALNLGVAGDLTENLIWRLEHYPLDKISPKAACILIGVNNLNTGSTPTNTALGIRKVVTLLREKYPNIKITVLKVFPCFAKDKVDAINQMIGPMLIGFDNLQVVDISDKFLTARGTLTANMMPDYLHPNDIGYEIWGNAIEEILREMLQ